jgi:hypothetical protein
MLDRSVQLAAVASLHPHDNEKAGSLGICAQLADASANRRTGCLAL